jgi:hypothetical protein
MFTHTVGGKPSGQHAFPAIKDLEDGEELDEDETLLLDGVADQRKVMSGHAAGGQQRQEQQVRLPSSPLTNGPVQVMPVIRPSALHK